MTKQQRIARTQLIQRAITYIMDGRPDQAHRDIYCITHQFGGALTPMEQCDLNNACDLHAEMGDYA